jgi:uncharacterized HAD superfamily protein
MNFLKRLLKMPNLENKPVIAVDIDDVLADEMETVRTFINEKFGVSLSKDDYLVEAPYSNYWEHVWGVGPVEGTERYQAYLDSFEDLEHKTVDDAIEAIDKLKGSNTLVVVTARPGSLVNATHMWLDEHFPETFSSVEFVAVWSRVKKVSKAIICKEIQANYLIDDSPDHCNLAQEVGVQSLLFGERGWNRNAKLTEGIIRVKSWQEVLEYFDAKG